MTCATLTPIDPYFSEGLSSWSSFPELVGTVWKWSDNGLNGKLYPLEFLQNELINSLKVNKRKLKGTNWKLRNGGKVLEVKFHGSVKELRYLPVERKAVVINADTSSASAMWGSYMSFL